MATVCMPWRPAADRIAAHDRCIQYWNDNNLPVIEADSDPSRPFLCNQARNNAVRKAASDVVVVADADTLPADIAQIDEAVQLAAEGKTVWPYTMHRLIENSAAESGIALDTAPVVLEHETKACCLIVISRANYWAVGGFDEGFTPGVWGFDDLAFIDCVETLFPTARVNGIAYGFDHAVVSGGVPGRDGSVNNPNRIRYETLYRPAYGDSVAMRKLIGSRGA